MVARGSLTMHHNRTPRMESSFSGSTRIVLQGIPTPGEAMAFSTVVRGEAPSLVCLRFQIESFYSQMKEMVTCV
jgi:hypothetical protein